MASPCCMTGCTAQPAQDVYYFPLPTKPALRRRWLAAIRPRRKLGPGASVCSAHFARADYETVRGRTRLKKNKVPMDIDEKTQSEEDHSNSNDTESKLDETNTAKERDSNSIKEKYRNRGKETENFENSEKETENFESSEKETEIFENGIGEDTLDSETGDKLGDKLDSQGEKEKEDQMETETNGINGAHDPNAVEIQITPDIIEDYNPIQATPDSIEDYDALRPAELCPGSEHDIEDILTNYHIMHPPHRARLRHDEDPDEKPSEKQGASEKSSEKQNSSEKQSEKHNTSEKRSEKQNASEKPSEEQKASEKPAADDVQTIDDEDDDLPLGAARAPVFIEIPVDKGRRKGSEEGDCLMVLESVQVSIDPRALLLSEPDGPDGPEPDEPEQIEIDDKSEHDLEKEYDPISLLTSSDEDEVIIEEPHVDTVEVSDETDEDDVPLVRLAKADKLDSRLRDEVNRIFWGAQEYYCKTCHFVTYSSGQYRAHAQTHARAHTALQVCAACGFTTASEQQFARHKKKHKDDKRYKCHLCQYSARHSMSLMYHLKTHEAGGAPRCARCGFRGGARAVRRHARACRPLARHAARKHAPGDHGLDLV